MCVNQALFLIWVARVLKLKIFLHLNFSGVWSLYPQHWRRAVWDNLSRYTLPSWQGGDIIPPTHFGALPIILCSSEASILFSHQMRNSVLILKCLKPMDRFLTSSVLHTNLVLSRQRLLYGLSPTNTRLVKWFSPYKNCSHLHYL